ncbi:MAG TPA: hypothetical protein VFO07_01865 [Roseiflexaceae bacterium]|nr:hypothetical protein [Roseiflexaceae bacterium]
MRGELLVSERLYRALLYLYPKEFRAAYGQHMRLTFRDACRHAYRRGGVGGLLVLWLPTLLDLFKSAIEERSHQGELTMSKTRLIALAGPLTIVVGSMRLVASIGEFVLLTGLASADTFWDVFWLFPTFLSFIPLLFALIGTRLRFHQSTGVPGRLGLVLSVAGCAGMIVFVLVSMLLGAVAPEVEQGSWANYVMAVCVLSLMIGYMLFGVDALRYRLLPRWNLLPLLMGSTVVFSVAPDWFGVPNYHPLQFAASFLQLAISGVCWVLLGIAMMDQRREPRLTAAI